MGIEALLLSQVITIGGTTGQVVTKQADGSLALENAAGGGIGGSTGSTDNAILRANGTGGATIQNSGVTIGDNNEVIVASGSTSAIPLIVRDSAGQTASLTEWQSSAAAARVVVTAGANGKLEIRNSSGQIMRLEAANNNMAITGVGVNDSVSINGPNITLAATNFVNFNNTSSQTVARTSWTSQNFRLEGNTNGTLTIAIPHSANSNQGNNAINITGQNAQSTATNVLIGGSINITAGNGASASAGAARGGDVNLTPGIGYGTGRTGLVILANVPTSNPNVAGAIWNESGTLKISAG
jgi:hypothetical protein